MEVKGFKASAIGAGIRYRDRLDLGLIVSRSPSVSAAVFTRNSVKAAPVRIGINRFSKGPETRLRALIVNSGNANACTGDEGIKRTYLILGALSKALGVPEDQVLMCSTGVIGQQIPHERVIRSLPLLIESLSKDGLAQVSRAILTTDTREKTAKRAVTIEGKDVTILGIAKGSGMIAPALGPPQATMLAFVLTDAAINGPFLQKCLEEACNKSFNRITVDGDMSTNDTVIAMASGESKTDPLNHGNPDHEAFSEALFDICKELASRIVEDGEGATKAVSIWVKGARDLGEARRIAEAVANSSLVKTAFYGEDPNWGRILASAGKTLIPLDDRRIRLWIGGQPVVEGGMGLGSRAEEKAKAVMKEKSFEVILDLGLGNASYRMLTTDLTDKYISINASYRS